MHISRFRSIFDSESTTDEVLRGVDLAGKRVLITGVSSGLGAETARTLLEHGAEVVGVARNIPKALAAIDNISSPDRLRIVECDLASLASIRTCAAGLNAANNKFDVVIANAGVMAIPEKRLTVDGFEMQFGTNHLGHLLLVNRVADLIRSGGRVVSLTSAGHRHANVNLEDPNFDVTEYTPFGAYGRSKTANVLFAVEFDRRHREHSVRATAVHPGNISTELLRHMGEGEMDALVNKINASLPKGETFRWKSVPQGAATVVWAGFVANAEEVGGRYCEDCRAADLSTRTRVGRGVQPYAVDPEHAKALWIKSEELVGEKF